MRSEYIDYVVVGFSLAGIASALTLAKTGERVIIVDYHRDTDPIADLPRVQATRLGPTMSGIEFEEAISTTLKRAGVDRSTVCHVAAIDSDRDVTVECSDRRWLCKGVVFAPNGTEPGIDVEGAPALFGFGVSYSATADAPFYASRRVAVYGDSPRVIEHASVAAQYASEVAVLIKQEVAEGDPEILRSLRVSPSVTLAHQVVLRSLRSSTDGTLSAIGIETATAQLEIDVSALFVAQHLEPLTDLIRDATENIVFTGLSAGVPYWKHAELVDDGVRAARALATVHQ